MSLSDQTVKCQKNNEVKCISLMAVGCGLSSCRPHACVLLHVVFRRSLLCARGTNGQ